MHRYLQNKTLTQSSLLIFTKPFLKQNVSNYFITKLKYLLVNSENIKFEIKSICINQIENIKYEFSWFGFQKYNMSVMNSFLIFISYLNVLAFRLCRLDWNFFSETD